MHRYCSRIALAGLFCVLCFSSCNNSMKEINEVTQRDKLGEDKGRDVTILYSVGGVLKARLFAHVFIRNEAADPPYTEMKEGLRADFFNESGQLKSTVTARYGRYYEKAGNVLLRDSVHVVNDKGEKLDTQELIWNEQMQKFFTEKPVRITTPTQVLIGTGMEASQDFSVYQITNIQGSVQLEKSQLPE
ncbi:MAG: LPS export ABC transporter periplasmic protein LptC [Bacteroidetes bacterium]|nr:LPS export ABC transporter periplasmic protein LptC [Bacteroidota bacterium]MBS1630275.1 LPS export ABC transporter periplasmic protein LptC [Bacteroidota bacterium]